MCYNFGGLLPFWILKNRIRKEGIRRPRLRPGHVHGGVRERRTTGRRTMLLPQDRRGVRRGVGVRRTRRSRAISAQRSAGRGEPRRGERRRRGKRRRDYHPEQQQVAEESTQVVDEQRFELLIGLGVLHAI